VRIALVHNLSPGGAKRALVETGRRLAQRGHDIDVFELASPLADIQSPREFARSVNRFDIPPFVDAKSGVLTKLLGDMRFYRRLRGVYEFMAAAINRGGYDVAYVHHCRFTQSPFVLPALRIPSVYFCQEPPRALYEPAVPRPYEHVARGIRGRLRRAKLDRLRRWDVDNVMAATVLLANSFYSAEVVYRVYGIEPVVARLGVTAADFAPSTEAREHMVVSVGSLIPNKGHDLVIESVGQMDAGERPRVVIASPKAHERHPEEIYLRSLAAARGVTLDIRQLSETSDIAALLGRALANVYVPRLEPFGLVPLEAMACETPTIGVAEGGVRETVTDGVTGILCERDPEIIAAAIRRLATDSTLVTAMGKSGREEAGSRWTWDRTTDAVERGIHRAIQTRHPKG